MPQNSIEIRVPTFVRKKTICAKITNVTMAGIYFFCHFIILKMFKQASDFGLPIIDIIETSLSLHNNCMT